MSTFLDTLTVEQAERIISSNMIIGMTDVGANVSVTAGNVTENLVDAENPERVYGIVNLRLATEQQEADAIAYLDEGDLANAIRQNLTFSIRPEDFGKFARGINYVASIGLVTNRNNESVIAVTGLTQAPVSRPRPSKLTLRKRAQAEPVVNATK